MSESRTSRRRAAAITGAKILITSASLAATVGGWVLLSSGEPAAAAATTAASTPTQTAPALGQGQSGQTPQFTRPRRNRNPLNPGFFQDQGGQGTFGSPLQPSFRSRSSR